MESSMSIAELKEQLDRLTDEQRWELIREYCAWCGAKGQECPCGEAFE